MTAISEKIVSELPVPETGQKLHYFSGARLQGKVAPSGFAVRVTSTGGKAFVWFHRVERKKFLETLGRWAEQGGELTVLGAINKCIDRNRDIARGVDKKGEAVDVRPARTRTEQDGDKPVGLKIGGAWEGGETAPGLLDIFAKRYIDKNKLRTGEQIKAHLKRLVAPRIGNLDINAVRRSHISRMLDEIADENGERMADLTLAFCRKAFNWFETNGADDDFRSPIVRGMARQKPKERMRSRVLDADEIRDLWAALDTIKEPTCYATYIKFLFLTATRRTEASDMHERELQGDVWVIPGARYKNKRDHAVPLSAAARKLIGKPKKGSGYVLSTTGGTVPFSGFSKAKDALDEAIAEIRAKARREPMEPWTLHDLRRTARTLMSRAGVDADVAERCLGHTIQGVRATYDWHDFLDEKRAAFEKLAATVDTILNPPEDNVIAMRR